MDEVFVYWDNSNIFQEMQRLAEERDEGPDARYRVRIHFDNLLRLAHADRPLRKAFAAGSIPPEMRGLWNRMEARGVEVALFDRGQPDRGEQEMSDRLLQLRMLEDALDFNGTPGIVTLLTGDGSRLSRRRRVSSDAGADAQTALESGDSLVAALVQPADAGLGGGETGCSSRSTTSTSPSPFWRRPKPGYQLAMARRQAPLDLAQRPMV